ncbi:MAG: protein translocase subunit SecF, partial [Candidatus Aenigmatarchaeota archaeon]
GASFFQQAQIALLIAFIAMSITIFIIFRVPMPSIYVILCGASDLITALAASQLLGIKLSLATFSALLMLVGYSVDTDVLLTSRVLKSAEGDINTKIRGAMRTGLTMTGTAIAALAALYIISSSSVIIHIASVLLLGLLADIPYTWITNAGLLRWYVERKAKKAII